MTIRVGLDSTKVLLTDVGVKWFTEHYPKGIVYEYDEAEPFDLKSMGANFVEVTCPMGIPYRFPIYIEGKITFQMVDQEEKPRHVAVEARVALPLDRGVKCYGGSRSVPRGETGTRGKEDENGI